MTTTPSATSPTRAVASLAMKVPEATLAFWIAKLASTAFGEAFSDFVFFNNYIGQHLAIALGGLVLIACVAFQMSRTRHIPWVYWLAVSAVSIFGTMSADFLNKDLGMSLTASTIMFLVLQALTFAAWYAVRRTLDVHSVVRGPSELFYWLTVIFTFALGTAAGDFVATTLGLGSLASAGVFAALILVPALAFRMGLSAVASFWIAYTFTRPLGASVADWLGVPAPYGDGLQIGTGVISAVTAVLLGGVIAVIQQRHAATRREMVSAA